MQDGGWQVLSGGQAPALHSSPTVPSGLRPRIVVRGMLSTAGVTKGGGRNDDFRPARLDRHHRLRVAGGEGVHVGEDEFAGAVAAELGLVMFLDDGEGS